MSSSSCSRSFCCNSGSSACGSTSNGTVVVFMKLGLAANVVVVAAVVVAVVALVVLVLAVEKQSLQQYR